MKKSSAIEQKAARQYHQLQEQLAQLGWMVQGTVQEVPPRSAKGNTCYAWTRKVNNKTVTVALSREQFDRFREAIAANREAEALLKQMRELSRETLLAAVPGVPRRRRRAPDRTGPETS